MQLVKGQTAPGFVCQDIWGNHISLEEIKDKRILLSFFRYAECAVCQLRVSEIRREKERFEKEDIMVIAVFQSPAESLKLNIVNKIHVDFSLLADPDGRLYTLYAVKPSWLKMLKTISLKGIRRVFESAKAGFKPGGKVEGRFHQIPADFLISKDKKIIRAHYGDSVIDHIPLEEIWEAE